MSSQYVPPQQYQQPQQAPQQSSGGYPPKNIIGGWSCEQNYVEPGKYTEYEVESIPLKNGGSMKKVTFFRRYLKRDKSWGKGFSFLDSQLVDLVERINHFISTYGKNNGRFVFIASGMEAGIPQCQQPAPQQYQPQQPPQQAPQPAPVQQGMGFAPPPPPPQWNR